MPRGIDKDTVPDRARGRALFAATCTGCHGGNADGNGPWGKDPRVRPSPANLHARSSAMGRLYFIISNGREGTMMAPQKDAFDEKAR
jgi:mono/diheme cytochrome c family protein